MRAKFSPHERSCRSRRDDIQLLRLSAILVSTFYPPGRCCAMPLRFGGICSLEEFAVGAVTAFLDSVPAAELADRKAGGSLWCMSEDRSRIQPSGFGAQSRTISGLAGSLNQLQPLRRDFAATRRDCGKQPRPPCLAKYASAAFAANACVA
jgi:hypothetical protein